MQNGFMGITPKPLSQSDFLIEDWLIQPSLNLIVRGSVINHLEPKAMQVLVYLAEHPGEVVSKDTFITAVWPDTFVSEQVLTNAIWQIRQAFGNKNKEFIQTIPKSGYRLTAKVFPNWAEFEAGYQKALFQLEEPKPESALIPAPKPLPPVQRKFPIKITIASAALIVVVVIAYVFGLNLRAANGNVTIGVLPFKNLSGNSQQEFVSDGMTDELIVQLGNLRSRRLGVIARTTMMTYKDSSKRVDEIGKELGADYILEGGVKRDGDIVRVTANLIEVKSQRQLWSRNYQQASKDISLLQSDIASSIAEQINLRLTPQQRAKLSNPKAVNPAAWDEYQQGMYLLAKFNRTDVTKAIEHYRRAAELDPTYAQPHVGLADAYFIMGQPLRYMAGVPPREYLAKSKEEALRAVELDPELASAHSLLATAKFYNDWDWTGAEEEFRKALELDPNSTSAHFYYALFLTFAGRPQEAAPHIRRGLELDPLRLALVTLAAELYMDSRDYDKAFQHVNRVLELDPKFEYARSIKFSLLLNTHRYSEAVDLLKNWMASDGKSQESISRLERSFEREGPKGIYNFLLADIPSNKPIFNFHSALLHTFLGNRDNAIEFLEKSYQEHDASLLCIGTHPGFDSMRDDPRFRDLMTRVGIPK